jgi:outer membrane beta-barrel protein
MKTLLLVGLVAGTAWAQTVGDVKVHVLEERDAKAGRFEVSLFPAAVQLNGRFTQHVGTFGAVTWHLRERFALQLLGGGNWHNVESSFNGELVEKFRVEAQASESLLWTWGVFGGVEVEPLLAKFTIANGPLVHFGLVISGGAGAGGTRHQLKPETGTPATYGDTGVRFMGTFAAGFRLSLGKHFTARLEVRDVVYSATINQVNGCSRADLQELDLRTRAIQRDPEPISAQCRTADFERLSADVLLARNLTRLSGSSVLHNAGLYLGAGFVF